MDHKCTCIPEAELRGWHGGQGAGWMLHNLGWVLGLSEPHLVPTWSEKYMDLIAS